MADKRKLPRISMGTEYTTGDAQDWTYEYTWEDFNAAISMYPTATMEMPEWKLNNNIITYFREHPELLPQNGMTEMSLITLRKIY